MPDTICDGCQEEDDHLSHIAHEGGIGEGAKHDIGKEDQKQDC
jgi:hypothetical protein